jgi:ribosome-binding factor A
MRMEITQMLAREVHDPGIGFLTVTHVQVTPDLQHARVYFTVLGDAKARRDTERALARVAPFLKRQIGHRLRLKRVPDIEFHYDESIARHDRIEQLLQDIHNESLTRQPDTTERDADHDDD